MGKGTRARMNPLPAAVRISPLIFLSPSTEHKALSTVPISGGPRELTFDLRFCAHESQALLIETTSSSLLISGLYM